MIPQILQQLGGGLQLPPQVRQMIQIIRGAGNPQAMLAQMMQNTPQMKQVMDIVNRYGGDADKAFRAVAEENGINTEEILRMIR